MAENSEHGLGLRRDGLLAGAGAAQRAQQRAVVGAHWRADIGLDAELARGLGVRPAARDIAGAGAPLIERALAQRVGPGHVHAFGDLHAAFIARIAHVLDAGLQVDRGQVGGLQPGDGPEHVQQRARQLLDALGVGQGRRQFREYPVHGGSFARGWGGTAIGRVRGPAMRDYARPAARAARRFQASERPNSASIQSRSAATPAPWRRIRDRPDDRHGRRPPPRPRRTAGSAGPRPVRARPAPAPPGRPRRRP